MKKYLLVINAGSSSIKFTVYQVDDQNQLLEEYHGNIENKGLTRIFKVQRSTGESVIDQILPGGNNLEQQENLGHILAWLQLYLLDRGYLLAAGHRVVHGGSHYNSPVLLNSKIVQELETLIPLAPLHQPHNLAAIKALQKLLPELVQVACFDTAFHQTQPEVAQYTGLPRHFFDEGIRRYGFHGLSFEYISFVLPSFDPNLAKARVIIAHLGNGASLCALQNGRSIATTMGFSPLDGLLMGTRCGSLDPGVLIYLMKNYHMAPDELAHLLYYESGLLGMSGISNDMRDLIASSDDNAKKTIACFVYRIVREIGSLTAALGGLDALVFTGGIGENSAAIRALVCQQSAWLGIELDSLANTKSASNISVQNSKVSVWVIPANENYMIAQHTRQLESKMVSNHRTHC